MTPLTTLIIPTTLNLFLCMHRRYDVYMFLYLCTLSLFYIIIIFYHYHYYHYHYYSSTLIYFRRRV